MPRRSKPRSRPARKLASRPNEPFSEVFLEFRIHQYEVRVWIKEDSKEAEEEDLMLFMARIAKLIRIQKINEITRPLEIARILGGHIESATAVQVNALVEVQGFLVKAGAVYYKDWP